MRLVDSNGVRIEVSDEKGERLLRTGEYRRPSPEKAAPPAPAARRSRRPTTEQ